MKTQHYRIMGRLCMVLSAAVTFTLLVLASRHL